MSDKQIESLEEISRDERAFDKWWNESGITGSQATTEEAAYTAWLEGMDFARQVDATENTALLAELAAKDAALAQNSSAFDELAEQAQMLRRDLGEAQQTIAELRAIADGKPVIIPSVVRAIAEREAARADAAALRRFLETEALPRYREMFDEVIGGQSVLLEDADRLLALPSPGAPLLAELERLRANEPQPPEYSRHGEDEC